MSVKISTILQAINNLSSNLAAGNTKVTQQRAEFEQNGILACIRREQEFIDGMETVYRALLQMQTIVALGIQSDKGL